MTSTIVAITVHKGCGPLGIPCQSTECEDPATSIITMVAYDSEWEMWSCQAHAEDFKIQIAGEGTAA